MRWWEALQSGARRALFGKDFEERILKALPKIEKEIVRHKGVDVHGLAQSPFRRPFEPGGKAPRKVIGFPPQTLRRLRRTNPWLRAAVDIRKRELAWAQWDIVPKLDRFEKELISLRRLMESIHRFPDRVYLLDNWQPVHIPVRMAQELIQSTRNQGLSKADVRNRFALALTDRHREAESHCAIVRPLFENPNRNPRGWGHIVSQATPDLFDFDGMALELRRVLHPSVTVSGKERARYDNRIIEIHPVDGATVYPIMDKYGMQPGVEDPGSNAIAYEQRIDGRLVEDNPGWRFWDLAYMQENPSTDIDMHGYGFGRVESLVITSLLEAYSDKSNLEEYKREMRGGFLTIQREGYDIEDAEEWRDYIEYELEGTHKMPVITIDKDGDVKWVATTRNGLQDKKTAEAAVRLVKRISATFELPLIKLAEHMGQTNYSTSRTTQSMDDDGQRKLYAWFGDAITRNVVAQFGFDDIAFTCDPRHRRDEKERLEIAKQKLELGIWEPNDARIEWGEDPREDGDQPYAFWTEYHRARGRASAANTSLDVETSGDNDPEMAMQQAQQQQTQQPQAMESQQ